MRGEDEEVLGATLALLARLPEGAAQMEQARDPGGQLMVVIKPQEADAAEVAIKVTHEGRIEMKVAHSRFDIVTDTSGPTPPELLAGILEGVFAGRAAFAPGRKGGTLKVEMYDGNVVRLGEVMGGRPWHTYAAYGPMEQLERPRRRPKRGWQALRDRFGV